MIRPMPIKISHHSVLWPGTHRKQGRLSATACTGSWHVWAAPSLFTESVNIPWILHYMETQKPFCVTAVVSPPSAWLTKTRCITNYTDQSRTLPPHPPMHCLCKSFSPSCRSLGALWLSEWLLLFTMCVAVIPTSVSVSVLDSLFLCPFLFILSFSVPVPARPFLLSSILLFPRHSECYSKMCLHRTHTPRALNAGEEDVLPRNFPARQHCCPSHQSRTKGNLFSCPLFARGSSGNERNDSLHVWFDRCKNDHKSRRWQTLTGKPDLTLTVFLMKICVSIRGCRHG